MKSSSMFRDAPALRDWPIVVLRVYTGIYFLYYGVGKLRRDNFADSVGNFVISNLESCFGFFRPVMESVFLPNKAVFALLVAWGEFALGIALIFGLMTRYAAIAGAFMVAIFWFAKGQGILDSKNHDIIWLIILIVLAGLHAGRVMGLDQRLSQRFRFLA